MPLIKAFAGLRPATQYAADVAAPPYDVVSTQEARDLVKERPWSFLHISRPEVDLPEGTDPYAPEVYAKAAENLQRMEQEGILVRDDQPCYYIYRLTLGEHRQTGLVAAASVQAYDEGRIKKHELTRPTKEDDRVRQVDALNAQTGPVFLVYRSEPTTDQLLQTLSATPAEVTITRDQVCHEIWPVKDSQQIAALTTAFDQMDALYVADGHHRSAAASRVAGLRREANPQHHGEESYNYFLSVIFPHHQMRILDYNRVVRDLNGLEIDAFLARVAEQFVVEPSEQPVKPQQSGEFGMYLKQQWYRLLLPTDKIPADPVARLDVSLLADHLIAPILGITDPRRDDRIDFVGGIRGLEGLMQRVDSGEMQLAFSLYPTEMEALMAVADADHIMPPKSTWFEPKLADGLVSHVLD